MELPRLFEGAQPGDVGDAGFADQPEFLDSGQLFHTRRPGQGHRGWCTETCIHRAERIAQRLQYPAEASQVEIDHTALSDRHVDAVADGGLRASELVQVEVIG